MTDADFEVKMRVVPGERHVESSSDYLDQPSDESSKKPA